MDHPAPGGYKYGDLALQVGGVSNETIKYGHEFCWIWTRELLLWQGPKAIVRVITDPSSHQRGHSISRNSEKKKSGHMPQMGA
jgi:hypothetical protein